MSIAALIDTLRRRELALLDPQSWDDRNDSYFMKLYKERCEIQGLYAMCGSLAPETYHHWRVFTGGDGGACLVIKSEALLASIRGTSGYRAEKVQYSTIEDIERSDRIRISDLPFVKRKGFSDEKEFRIIFEDKESIQKPFVKLPLESSWINRVVINPWLPKQLAESLRQTLKQTLIISPRSNGEVKVVRSSLINNNKWQQIGSRVAKQ